MRERPILFSAPMVRAILAGRKTQTRRIVKPQPIFADVGGMFACWQFAHKKPDGYWLWPNAKEHVLAMCPHGKPGDRLWVRETHEFTGGVGEVRVLYKADGAELPASKERDLMPVLYKGRPSIFMPRWASRINLEITGLRVERLQDISEEDVAAEGVESCPDCDAMILTHRDGGEHWNVRDYAHLWNSINSKDAWDANPWVWVVEFKLPRNLPAVTLAK